MSDWRQAWQARLQGDYRPHWVNILAQEWQDHPNCPNLLRWLRMQRDLGLALNDEQQALVATQLALPWWHRLRQQQSPTQQLALRLLQAEHMANGTDNPETAIGFFANRCQKEAIALARQQQNIQQQQVIEQLQHARSIALVGNSGAMLGKGLGSAIDEHQVVFRFNHFWQGNNEADIGSKTSHWVVAADIRHACPIPLQGLWFSGPAMLWQRQSWRALKQPLHSQPLYHFSLDLWHELVLTLQAPPSAGLLLLAWFKKAGLINKTTVYGIGEGGHSRYHQALARHTASRRHNWAKETELIRQWRKDWHVA